MNKFYSNSYLLDFDCKITEVIRNMMYLIY